jgi:hypothetical protein
MEQKASSSMRRLILILSIVVPGIYILDYVLYCAAVFINGNNLHDVNAGFGVITNMILIGGAAALVLAWLLGLVSTATRRLWGWFVIVLLAPYCGSLAYSLTMLGKPQIQAA